MGDEQCFQTTAPEAWFGWAIASGVVALGVTLVAITLWLPGEPEPIARSRSWRQRALAAAPGVALLTVSFLSLSRLSHDEAFEMIRQSLVPVLVMSPFLGIAVWRERALRDGRSLSRGQLLILAGARVVTMVSAAGAALTAMGIFAAYMASSVQVDCSTIPN